MSRSGSQNSHLGGAAEKEKAGGGKIGRPGSFYVCLSKKKKPTLKEEMNEILAKGINFKPVGGEKK